MTSEEASSGSAPPDVVLTREPEVGAMGVGHLLVVPLSFVAMLITVGALVPDEYTEIGFAVGGIAMTALVFTGVGVVLARAQKQREALIRSFTPGTARVLEVRETGVRIRQRPQLEVRLEVDLPDRDPYVAIHLGTGVRFASLVEGEVLSVACDPNDRELMFIDDGTGSASL